MNLRIIAGLAVATVAGTCFATEPTASARPIPWNYFYRRTELSFSMKWEVDPDDDFELGVRAAPFWTPNIQAGVDIRYDQFSGVRSTFLGFVANYHFLTGMAGVPYVGVHAGWSDQTGTGTNTSYGFQAGMKYAMSRDIFAFGEFNYTNSNETGFQAISLFCFGLGMLFNTPGWDVPDISAKSKIDARSGK